VDRREFLRLTGVGLGTLVVPVFGRPVMGAVTVIPSLDRKQLADLALEAATTRGASYADVRIGRYRNEFVITREDRVQNLVSTESFGAGVRVLANGTWGFAATPEVTPDGLARAAGRAMAIARANARLQAEPVRLAPARGWGQVAWKTPIRKNAFDVPIGEKVELLLEVNARAREAGARFVNSMLFLVNEHKFFASTDGTWADQDIHRIWPHFSVTGVDPKSGRFQTRDALSEPMGMGWEYLDAAPTGKVHGVTTRYGSSYDMLEDAANAGREVSQKLVAKPVEPGTYDLVLDPSHLWLTIHESVGHPLELDRVLGYEANFAGTSFATLDKWRSGSFRYGSEIVTFFADRIQAGSLAAAGWDDEGVRTKRWDLVKDGILVDYQKTRDQAHILGQEEGDGSSYADSWSSVQFQRMPNVSLAAGRRPLSFDELVGGVEKGIYIVGRGSYSIDQQRYNFQFGGQLFYEIRDGKITGMLRDVAYQSNTQEFWGSCVQICDHRDYRLGGSFFDGKGEPGQVSAVSHGCATSRFNGVTVINTERTI
jgi:TldD protein